MMSEMPIRVSIYPLDLSNGSEQLATIDIYALPLEREGDFVSYPDGLVSLADAIEIANQIVSGLVMGKTTKYEWREEG